MSYDEMVVFFVSRRVQMETGNSFLKFFKKFYDEWNLDYEKKKIDLWREMRHLNSDLLLYTPSVNHQSDDSGERSRSGLLGSRSLRIISTFWDDLDQVEEIEKAINELPEEYKKAFFDYYIHEKNVYPKDYPFLKEDTLVELASHDVDYIFADEIKKKYDQGKELILDRISARRKEIKRSMFRLLDKHHKYLKERMLESDVAYLKESRRNGAYQRKEALYIDAFRYLEGDIDGQELWRCIASQKGGKKLFKKIFKG